jgi:VWFA-related protein
MPWFRSFRPSIVLSAVLLFALCGLAQSTEQQNPPADQEPTETLKIEVNVVSVFFNVKDKHGALVPNLTKTDFQVFEDGKPQTIKYFKTEADQPLTLGMLIDTSPSQTRVLNAEKEIGGDFLREVLRPKDLAFVVSFDANIDLLQDLTADVHQLRDALNRTHIGGGSSGGGGIPGLGGGPIPTSRACCTYLYDAVYAASNDKLSHEVGRKALIILTDGQDEGSREKIQDAIEAAQRADTICYVLMIADRGFYGGFGMGYSGDHDMRKLAEQTGGRVIEVGNNEKKLKEAFDQVANELRSQYSIGYTPTNPKRDGSFRRIEIKPKNKDMKVQARAGYYAASAD